MGKGTYGKHEEDGDLTLSCFEYVIPISVSSSLIKLFRSLTFTKFFKDLYEKLPENGLHVNGFPPARNDY